MGFMKNMFSALEEEIGNSLGASTKSNNTRTTSSSGPPPTRWEKAVVGLDSIVVQVVKVDPDGVDIVCFGGQDGTEWYRNIKNTKGLEEMVTAQRPKGACLMGEAMNEVVTEAFDNLDMSKRPVSVLVLTAGRPDDADELDATLTAAVARCAEEYPDKCPLSVTFVQIGNDERATEYLSHLDGHITATSSSGETFDLVDTVKDEEIQAAMTEIKGTKPSGKNGALIGAFAGAALGVGGMYIYNKQQVKKRTVGWGGKWKVSYDGQEICILNITDDEQGNLTIDGFPSGETTTGTYSGDDDDEYVINFQDPSGGWDVEGTVEDEHAITWSDGTRWDELPPDGKPWTHYAAAAAGGAAVAGATGYLLDKQFFNKASKKDQSDYIIMMDRSAKMAVVD